MHSPIKRNHSMKKILTFIICFISLSRFAGAQDTLAFGNDKYLFSQQYPNRTYIVNIVNANSIIHNYFAMGISPKQVIFNIVHTELPTKIYGIAAVLSYPHGVINRTCTASLLKKVDGIPVFLDSTSIVSTQNYFVYRFNHIRTSTLDIDSTGYLFPHIYEFYFDSGITVHDTFFVGIYNPGDTRLDTILLFQYADTMGEPWDYLSYLHGWPIPNPSGNYYIVGQATLFNLFPWGGIFPIIKPLNDTADSNGVRQVAAASSVRVEPNPAHGSVSVRAAEGLRRVEFYDMTGLRVLSREATGTETRIDIATLPAGIYVVRVHTTTGITSRKLVVF